VDAEDPAYGSHELLTQTFSASIFSLSRLPRQRAERPDSTWPIVRDS